MMQPPSMPAAPGGDVGASIRDEAISELNSVLESAEFKSFAEFCETQGGADVRVQGPQIAAKYIEDQHRKQVGMLQGSQRYCLEQQKNELAALLSSSHGRDPADVHKATNHLLLLMQNKVGKITAEIEKQRAVLQVQTAQLDMQHQQNLALQRQHHMHAQQMQQMELQQMAQMQQQQQQQMAQGDSEATVPWQRWQW